MQNLYNKSIQVLDNFLAESFDNFSTPTPTTTSWKLQAVYKLAIQSNHIMFCLLSNSEWSKFISTRYVTEPVLVGALTRVIRDIYVQIIYLKTEVYSEDEMKWCWDYQVCNKKLKIIEFENQSEVKVEISIVKKQKDELFQKIGNLNFSTKGNVLRGKDEKMLSLQEIADLKGFHKEKFYNEFIFFSQFSHATAFANEMIIENSFDFNLLVAIYDKIVPYYVGLVYEALSLLKPTHSQLPEMLVQYQKIIEERWTVHTVDSI